MHKVAPAIENAVSIPFLHIADATAKAIKALGIEKVGLLGTKFTMEQDFYVGRLHDHRLDVSIPGEDDRAVVHRIIYDELCNGQVHRSSREAYTAVIDKLIAQGVQGIILGCTEISMLIDPAMIAVPCFDTTALHATAAVEFSLDEN